MKAKYFYCAAFALTIFINAYPNEQDFETFLESLFKDPTKQAETAEEVIEAPTKDKAKKNSDKPSGMIPPADGKLQKKIISDLSDIKKKIAIISNAAKSAKYFEKKFREKLGAPKETVFSGYDAAMGQLLSHNIKEFYAELLATKGESKTKALIDQNLKAFSNLENRINSLTRFYDQDLVKIRKILEEKTARKYPTDTDVINEILLQKRLPFEKRIIPRTALAMIGERKKLQRELQSLYSKTIPNATKKFEAFIKKSKPTIEKKLALAAKQPAATQRDYSPRNGSGSYDSDRFQYNGGNRYKPGRYSGYQDRGDYGSGDGQSSRYDSFDDDTPDVETTKSGDDDKKDYGYKPVKSKLKKDDSKKVDDKKDTKKKRKSPLKKYTDELEKLDKAGIYEPKNNLWKIDPNALVKTNEILSKIRQSKAPRSKKLKDLMQKIATFVDGKFSPTLQKDIFGEVVHKGLVKEYETLKKNPKFEEIKKDPPIEMQYNLFKQNTAALAKIKATLENMKITLPVQTGQIKIIDAYKGIFVREQEPQLERNMIPDSCTGLWRSIVASALEKEKKIDPKNPVLKTGYFAHGDKTPQEEVKLEEKKGPMKLYIKYQIGKETHEQMFNITDRVTLDPKNSLGSLAGYETKEEGEEEN